MLAGDCGVCKLASGNKLEENIKQTLQENKRKRIESRLQRQHSGVQVAKLLLLLLRFFKYDLFVCHA